MGHAPVGVHSPAQALERLAEGFDLLFTDVVMPGPMDGLALAREALARQPGLRVLVASGYAQSLVDNADALPGPLLNKPYRRIDLASAIAGNGQPSQA
jgi:CheY-like chemotaxis protein